MVSLPGDLAHRRRPSLGREPHRGRSALALDPADLAAGASGAPSRFESHYAPIQGADARFGPRAELTEPAVARWFRHPSPVFLALAIPRLETYRFADATRRC